MPTVRGESSCQSGGRAFLSANRYRRSIQVSVSAMPLLQAAPSWLFGALTSWASRRGLGGYPTRVWPEPDEQLPGEVPRLIRVSIDDARKCFRAKVYAACAVMCGRALEAMCKEKTGQLILANGLKKLRTDNVIDDRLYQWGEALRKERNIGAHASDETISRADAQDILDFAIAIVEYVYVMSAKFEAYQQRKAKLATIKKSIKKAT